MENAMFPGDKILVSKLAFGPKVPRSLVEIPILQIFCYVGEKLGFDNPCNSKWQYTRLPGYTNIKHNDIILFESTENRQQHLVKRCVGLPGELFILQGGSVLKCVAPQTVKNKYHIFTSDKIRLFNLLDSLRISTSKYLSDQKKYITAVLTLKERGILEKYDVVDSIDYHFQSNNTLYVDSEFFKWTNRDFGPVLIPSKGLTIKMTRRNYLLYNKILKDYENMNLRMVRERFYNSSRLEQTEYTFKNNYYFMMGDNRDDSKDSRYIGFIPEENILGKGIMVLYSNSIKYSKNRFMISL